MYLKAIQDKGVYWTNKNVSFEGVLRMQCIDKTVEQLRSGGIGSLEQQL